MAIARASMNANYLTNSQLLAVQHTIIRIGAEFLFFGIQALLFIVSTWLLFRKGIGAVRARVFLPILTSIMFLASLGVIIIDRMISLRQASSYGLNAPVIACGMHVSHDRHSTTAILDFVRNTQGPNTLSLVLTLPPLITNLVATSLIALKVWDYRKQIKSILTTSTTSRISSTRTEQVLLVLVGNGFLYCAVWLLILIAGFDDSRQ
ncbi:hypothetical protein E1B28_008523 [Marasmius oreades]|uniref:Uncharacterized protein n=1 Tax=Marasmius oreades TaxID=181124 RepID=A0A9P7RYI0_9AGAR|nr:uncharacterized protein E1B28_008523 [Marasmius oreades]KAG7092154.1 hypothetical protein E1B28_008523 [Marasmius oreades]